MLFFVLNKLKITEFNVKFCMGFALMSQKNVTISVKEYKCKFLSKCWLIRLNKNNTYLRFLIYKVYLFAPIIII